MKTKEARTKESVQVRVYVDKKPRIEKLRRRIIAAEDRNLSEAGLIDEILEEGLSKRERKLGIE